MSETIKELIKRKKENAQQDLKDAKRVAEKMIAEATKQAEKLVSFHEGKVSVLENMEELDWQAYAKRELEAK